MEEHDALLGSGDVCLSANSGSSGVLLMLNINPHSNMTGDVGTEYK